MEYKEYKIETEAVSDGDGQTNSYRVAILDRENNVLKKTDRLYSSQEEALENGRIIVEGTIRKNKLKENEIDFTKRVWTKRKQGQMNYTLKILIFSGASVLVATVLMVILMSLLGTGGTVVLLTILIFVVALGIAIYIFVTGNMSNFVSFVLDDGYLYRILFTNKNASAANALSAIGFGGIAAGVALSGNEDARSMAASVSGMNDVKKLQDKPKVWQIVSVNNVKKRRNSYKVKAVVIDIYSISSREKKKTFKIRADYADFESLLKCFNVLKETTLL